MLAYTTHLLPLLVSSLFGGCLGSAEYSLQPDTQVPQALEEPSSNTYRWGKFTKRMIREVTNTVDHTISNVFAKLLQIYNIRKEE